MGLLNLSTRARIGAGLCAVGGVASIIVWHQRSAPSPKAVTTSTPAAAIAAPEACHFTPAPMGYSVNVTSGVSFSGGSGAKAEFPMTARLFVTTLTKSDDAVQVLAARFTDVEGQGMDAEGLKTPFLLRVNARCEVLAFARHRDADHTRARPEQAIANELHFVLTAPGTAVTTHNGDGSGAFLAELSTTAENERTEVAASARRYEKAWVGPRPEVKSQSFKATVDSGPWFASIEAARVLATEGAEQTMKVSFQRIGATDDDVAAIPREESEYVWEDLLANPTVETSGDAVSPMEAEAMRALSPEEAKKRYVELFDSQAHIGAAGTFLREYAEANPKFAFEVLHDVRDGKIDGMMAATVFPALQITRTKEARLALAEMRGDVHTSPFDRARSTISLAARKDTSLQFVAEISLEAARLGKGGDKFAKFATEQAVLALGLVVHYAPAEVAAEAKRQLASHVNAHYEAEDLGGVIRAVGNTGDAEFLPNVQRWADSADDHVREKAPAAFRKMPLSATHDMQIAWVKRERNIRVRAALYENIRQQAYEQSALPPVEVMEHALDELATATDYRIKDHLIRLLGDAAQRDATIAKRLGAHYAHEDDADLRKLIGTFVKGEDLGERSEP